jgi:hypothetical protein
MAKKIQVGVALEALDEPLPPLKIGLLMDDDEVAERLAERTQLETQKLIMLLMHFGLELGDYRGLSLALARESFRGFREAKRKGRKTKWTDYALGNLFVEVERERIKRGLRGKKNNPDIYCTVAHQAPWDSFLETVDATGIDHDPAEAIRQAYSKAKKLGAVPDN